MLAWIAISTTSAKRRSEGCVLNPATANVGYKFGYAKHFFLQSKSVKYDFFRGGPLGLPLKPMGGGGGAIQKPVIKTYTVYL